MAADPLTNIGKGIIQINLRLNRVLELLERPEADTPRETAGEREVAFDLLDAIERALERPRAPTGWWQLFTRKSPQSSPELGLVRGMELARARALEQLRRLGIETIDTTGDFDPELHEAIERLPTPSGARKGDIARTHRSGFTLREGSGRRVLRLAQVSVYREAPPPALTKEQEP